METTERWITTDEVDALLTEPATPPTGGMILLPMITGIGRRVKHFATTLAQTGLTVVCWDPFDGASSDTHPHAELVARRDQLDDHAVLAEVQTLFNYVRNDHGLTATGVIGYCLGGRYALLFGASEDRLANVVAYHPTIPSTPHTNHTLEPCEQALNITAPVLIHYPAQDHLTSHDTILTLQTTLLQRQTGETITAVYPEAEHGFSDDTRHHTAANRTADTKAWDQTVSFLHSTI